MDHSVIICKYNISISLQGVVLLSFDPQISTCTSKNKLVQPKTTTTPTTTTTTTTKKNKWISKENSSKNQNVNFKSKMKIFIESTFEKVLFSKYYLRKFEGIRIHLLVQLITVTEIELLRTFDGMNYLLTSS